MFVIFKILRHSIEFCSDDLELVTTIQFDNIPTDELLLLRIHNILSTQAEYNMNNIELSNYGYAFAFRRVLQGVSKAEFLIINIDHKNIKRKDIESIAREVKIDQIIS